MLIFLVYTINMYAIFANLNDILVLSGANFQKQKEYITIIYARVYGSRLCNSCFTDQRLSSHANTSLSSVLCSSLHASQETSQEVTYLEIAPGQARFTSEFLRDGLPKRICILLTQVVTSYLLSISSTVPFHTSTASEPLHQTIILPRRCGIAQLTLSCPLFGSSDFDCHI